MLESRLLLIRHGETQGNRLAAPSITGQRDVPLNEMGRNQAEKLSEALSHEPITAVFSSPLQRALDTARCIGGKCGAQVTCLDGLRDINCGQLEGEAISSVQHRLPELWALNESEAEDDFRWPGGETYRDLRQRVMVSLEEVALTCVGKTVAIVSHASVVTQVLGWVAQLPPRFWKTHRPDIGSITELFWGTRAVHLGLCNVLPEQWPSVDSNGTSTRRLMVG